MLEGKCTIPEAMQAASVPTDLEKAIQDLRERHGSSLVDKAVSAD